MVHGWRLRGDYQILFHYSLKGYTCIYLPSQTLSSEQSAHSQTAPNTREGHNVHTMPPRTATRATRPTASSNPSASSSAAAKSKTTASSGKTPITSSTNIPVKSRTRKTTATRPPSTLPVAVNVISEPLRKPTRKVAQVEPPVLTPSSLLEALAEQSLRGVSEKVVKDAQALFLPPATDRAPWDNGMETDDNPERIKERKERKKLVMKVLNATMGLLANVQKAGWKAGGESYAEENVRNVATICKNAITAFWNISKEENDKSAILEGEKAVLNIVGKLVQMQLVSDLLEEFIVVSQLINPQYESSWDLLHDTRSSLPNHATPFQVAAAIFVAAAYIDEVVSKTQDAQVVERLEGYLSGLPSGSLIASSEEERKQLQRGADRLRRAVGKVLPSAEGRVVTPLKRLLEYAVGIYEGLLKVRLRSRVYFPVYD
jgi:hypothetical protein